MDWVVISGAGRYDGRYELELEQAGLTTLEWGWVKRLAGYLPLTIAEGYRGADAELFTVLAVIALHRNGAITDAEVPEVFARLQRLAFEDTITMDSDSEGDDAAVPPTAASTSSSNGSSGDGSETSSASSEPPPSATGIPGSDTSVSAPATSAA